MKANCIFSETCILVFSKCLAGFGSQRFLFFVTQSHLAAIQIVEYLIPEDALGKELGNVGRLHVAVPNAFRVHDNVACVLVATNMGDLE